MQKPSVAIGHVVAKTANIEKTTDFYLILGLREIMKTSRMSILELRGGTHILFFKQSMKPKKPPYANFDLMADDLDAFRTRLKKKGVKVGKVTNDRMSGHRLFRVTDPDGRSIAIFSSHTDGRPV
jgi:catechol 2,3-dioxygenase-like lactoylglutathione lyase family enzyme